MAGNQDEDADEEFDLEAAMAKAEENFIEVKASFDKLVQLNDEYGGDLLIDPEAERAELIF